MGAVVTEQITIHKPGAPTGEYDELGNPIFSTPTSTLSDGWGVEPVQATENQETFGAAPVTGYRLYNPVVVSVAVTDEVTVRGDRCKVVGQPAVWESLYGTDLGGVVVSVERVA